MKFLKKIIWLAILAAAAFGGWQYFADGGSEKLNYRTEKIARGTISAVVSATGTLNPVQLVTVGSQVSGKVDKIYVKINDHVKSGQTLAEIDPALLKAQIKQDNSSLEIAKANYEQAERDLKRNQMLLAKDFIAKVTYEQAQQTALQAKNNYDAAKTIIERDVVNLNYATITAPIDGVIISQTVTEGQTLQASFQAPDLFKIAGNLTEMKIDVNFPESDITKIKVDMPVNFTVNAFPDRTFTGTVQTVNVNPASQAQGAVTYSVIIKLKNDDGVLLPGMTAYVSVILSQRKDVLSLPLAALRFNPPQEATGGLHRIFGSVLAKNAATAEKEKAKTVYVLRKGTLTPVSITTGLSDDAYTEIVSGGVVEGDEVVIGIQRTSKQ